MSLAALFTRRVRGVRLVNVWGAGLLLVLVVGLYLAKTLAGGERADIATTEMQIADEQRRIRLLHAELAYLEQPARLERLSEQYLGLQPVNGKRETSVDGLQQIAGPPTPAVKAKAEPPPAPPPQSPISDAPSAPRGDAQ